MPAKGKAKVTDRQRKQIAAGRVAGKRARQIAQETGLSKSTVDHLANDPRISTFTLKLKHENEPQLRRMFKRTLDTMEADLKSRNKAVCATARAQFLRLLPLGDPPLLRIAPADNSGGDFTLEELLTCYAQVSRGKA